MQNRAPVMETSREYFLPKLPLPALLKISLHKCFFQGLISLNPTMQWMLTSCFASVDFIIIHISHDFLNSWALIINTFRHSTFSPSGQRSTSWLDWIFIKSLWISDDTGASAYARHMHKMCINMVLFLSHWCGEWMFIGHLMKSIL